MRSSPPRVLAITLAAALGAGCGLVDESPDGRSDAPPDTCPSFAAPREIGKLALDVSEISGLAVSRANPGVLWTHEDGEGKPEVFAVDLAGKLLATLHLDKKALDPEDVAIGPGPEAKRSYLYLADTGDNDLVRKRVKVFRTPEPTVSLDDGVAEFLDVEPDVIELDYEGGDPHDAEATMIDAATGDLYLVAKRSGDDEKTRVYRARGIATAKPGDVLKLDRVLTDKHQPALAIPVTSIDRSFDGSWLLLGTKDDAFRLWPAEDLSIEDALLGAPCPAPRGEGQIESGAFMPDGSYLMIPEGKRPPLLLAEPKPTP
jgi:hypothetical protein